MLKSESAKNINGMLDLAHSEPGVPSLPDQLDADPWLLNCVNAAVDLRTGRPREHRREDLITKLCPTPYLPDAKCPAWLRFMEDVFKKRERLITFVQHCWACAAPAT